MSTRDEADLKTLQRHIAQREKLRCDALTSGDMKTLEGLVAEDLCHIHANGQCEDRDAYLNTMANHIEVLAANRLDLQIRVLGASLDVAVATGELLQTVRIRATDQRLDLRIFTTQVWTRSSSDGEWRQSSFQATHIT